VRRVRSYFDTSSSSDVAEKECEIVVLTLVLMQEDEIQSNKACVSPTIDQYIDSPDVSGAIYI